MEALAKVSVIPERFYRGYGFSGSYNRIPDHKRFGNDSFGVLQEARKLEIIFCI
jgi:hypothetical protein